MGGGEYYVFGAPYKEKSRNEYWDQLVLQYDGDLSRAQGYAVAVNDRAINKARGMISFNGILMAATLLPLPSQSFLAKIAFLILLISTILNLFAMIILWRAYPSEATEAAETKMPETSSRYETREYYTFSHACSRATAINLSIFLSLFASLILSAQVVLFS